MKFGMRSRHQMDLSPAETFLGDDKLDDETYKELMSGGYTAIAQYLDYGARSIGLDIDSTTNERWRRLIAAAYYIDEFIDDNSDKEAASHLYAIGLSMATDDDFVRQLETIDLPDDTDRLLIPSVIALKNCVHGVDSENLAKLYQAAQTIGRVAKQKADTDDVDDYIAMITEESDTTADLFDHIADDTTTSQAKYPIFSGTLHKAMRVSVYLDNALDLREDYEDGLTKVEPTIRNIGRIAVQAITPAREAARWGDSLKISWNMLKEIRPYIKD